MKILILSNKSPWPPKDGGSAATMNMMETLALKGVSVSVLAINTFKHYASPGEFPEKLLERFGFHFSDSDTSIRPLRLLFNYLFSKSPYSLKRFESKDYLMKLRQNLRRGFDFIQIEGLAMTSYIQEIRRNCNSRIIFRPHNVESDIWKQVADEEANFLVKYYLRNQAWRLEGSEKSVSTLIDGLIAITDNDLKWFLSNGLNCPHVTVPPGFFQEPGRPVTSLSASMFFMGSLDWIPNIKGLRWFIRNVWPLVTKEIPDAEFHVAGRNPGEGIKALCRRTGIIFHGEVDSAERFIADKGIMVAPLFSGSGIRFKILEAMSAGKAVVATEAAVKGITANNGRNIFISANAVQMASDIIKLIKDDSLRAGTGRLARENVNKNYNILAIADRLMNFYSSFS